MDIVLFRSDSQFLEILRILLCKISLNKLKNITKQKRNAAKC